MRPPGLVSVTLRSLEPEAVVKAAVTAGLPRIEWGADVHAPPDDPELVERCRRATLAAGLSVASYGSYWKAGSSGAAHGDAVLEAAVALGAPRVRVWAGEAGSDSADSGARQQVVAALQALAEKAADRGLELAIEHHPDTLSDTAEMTLRLLDEIGSDAVSTYWQPGIGQSAATALAELRTILDAAPDRLSAVHVFAWWPAHERHPLRTRADLWRPALELVRDVAPSCDVMLEFVPGDSAEVLAEEAETLRDLLRG